MSCKAWRRRMPSRHTNHLSIGWVSAEQQLAAHVSAASRCPRRPYMASNAKGLPLESPVDAYWNSPIRPSKVPPHRPSRGETPLPPPNSHAKWVERSPAKTCPEPHTDVTLQLGLPASSRLPQPFEEPFMAISRLAGTGEESRIVNCAPSDSRESLRLSAALTSFGSAPRGSTPGILGANDFKAAAPRRNGAHSASCGLPVRRSTWLSVLEFQTLRAT